MSKIIMKEYVEDMEEYVENIKDYVENMKKYVEVLDFAPLICDLE